MIEVKAWLTSYIILYVDVITHSYHRLDIGLDNLC